MFAVLSTGRAEIFVVVPVKPAVFPGKSESGYKLPLISSTWTFTEVPAGKVELTVTVPHLATCWGEITMTVAVPEVVNGAERLPPEPVNWRAVVVALIPVLLVADNPVPSV